ncbi:hypothetical protein OROMI_027937 [Orobanche minor]
MKSCNFQQIKGGLERTMQMPVQKKKIVTIPSSKRKCAKVKGDLLGKNDRTNMHIDRILGSYTQRQRNEFKDFMKPDDAKFDTRTSLTKLWLVNGKLQPDQKRCVEEMGFSSITKIEFEQLDRELVRWLARVANESHNKFPVEIDATHNLVSPSTEKERCGVELDEHITHEKENKKENFDGSEIDGNYFGDVIPPLQPWGIDDGYASTDDGSEEHEAEKCDERTNNKNTYFKFDGDSLHVPKVPPTLEARVSAMETIWCQVSQILNTKFVGQSNLNVGNSAMLTDNLLRQQIKLIEDLKDCITDMPKNMKSAIRSVMSEFVIKERQSNSNQRKTKSITTATLLSDCANSNALFENIKVLRCNPTSADEEIIQFLFNEKLSQSTTVIDYGRYHLTREDVRTLGPECKIRGTIIDAVSYMCTLNERTRTFFAPNWFFPSIMTKHILDGKKDDDTLLDWYFKGNGNFTNSVEHLERVHFPIHDQKDHWFLAIVDFNLNVIDVCDTAPDRSNKEQRRNLIQRVVQRFDMLMHKYDGKNYKAKNVNNFLYEDMNWVPRQNNGYDCGLYVFLLMLFEKGVECIRTTEESNMARRKLAVMLYKNSGNKFAWN